MTRQSQILTKILTYLILVIFFVSLQTSLLRIGNRASVQLCLILITYVALLRSLWEGVAVTIFTTFILGLFSVCLQSSVVLAGLMAFLSLRLIRTLVYVTNPVHFFWTTMFSIFTFHFFLWLISQFAEKNPASPRVLNWFVEMFVTALFVRITFIFLNWLDYRTKTTPLPEMRLS